jgi:hypothetical protein
VIRHKRCCRHWVLQRACLNAVPTEAFFPHTKPVIALIAPQPWRLASPST